MSSTQLCPRCNRFKRNMRKIMRLFGKNWKPWPCSLKQDCSERRTKSRISLTHQRPFLKTNNARRIMKTALVITTTALLGATRLAVALPLDIAAEHKAVFEAQQELFKAQEQTFE